MGAMSKIASGEITLVGNNTAHSPMSAIASGEVKLVPEQNAAAAGAAPSAVPAQSHAAAQNIQSGTLDAQLAAQGVGAYQASPVLAEQLQGVKERQETEPASARDRYIAARDALEEFNHTPTWELKAAGVDVETRQKELEAAVAAARKEYTPPSLGERIKGIVTGAAQQYAGTMADAPGVIVEGRGGTMATELYEDQLATLLNQRAIINEAARNDPKYAKDADTVGRLEQLNEQIRQVTQIINANRQTGAAARETAAELTQSGAENVEEASRDLGRTGRLLVNTGVAGAQMGADALIGAATGGGAMLPMMIRSFGGGAQEARQKGYSTKQQMALGLTNAATEYFTEQLFGGNPVYDTDAGLVNKLVGELVKNEKVLTFLASTPVEMLNEGLEEITSDILNPLAEWAIAGTRPEYEIGEIIEDGIVGVMMGVLGTGGSAALSRVGALALPSPENYSEAEWLARANPAQETATPSPMAAESVREGTDTTGAETGAQSDSAGQTSDPLINAIRQMGQQNAAQGAGVDAREVVAKLQASIPTMQSEPILTTLNGTEFPKSGGKLTEQVGEFFRKLGNSVFRSGLGNVILDKRGVKSDIAHGVGRAKAITFAAVPDVIANGKQIDFQQNWKGRGYDTYVFAAPVDLAGKKTYVAAVVRSDANHRFYLHEVVDENGSLIYKIDAPEAIKTGVAAQDGITGTSEAPIDNITIPQGAENVKNGLPRGIGAAEAGFTTPTKGVQVQTQNKAITENPMLSNKEQLQFAPGTHERVTAEMSTEQANTLFYTDAEGNIVNLDETINGLLEKELWTGAEQDAAQKALGILLQEARETGDYSKAETLVRAIERIGTETGRSLQARQKWARFLRSMTPEGRFFMIEKSVEQFQKQQRLRNEIKISDELKTRFLNAETEEARDAVIKEMQKEVGKQLPSTALEKWNALRYVNMLGNFKTQIRNLSGNVVMKGVTWAKDAVATGIEAIASKVSGGRIERTKALNPGKELRAAAKADFQIVKDIASGESRYSISEGKNDATNFMKGAQEQKTVFKLGDNALTRALGIENKKGLVVYRTLEAYRKATNFMMNNGIFGDEAFLRGSYTHALAGYLKAHNISAEQFTNSDWQSNNADFVDTARAYAIKEAQEATFRDTNAVSKWVSQIARKDSTPKLARIAGEGLAPFRKTPANVAVRAEEYSPLGLINTAVMAAQKANGNADITGADIINQFSKSFTGSVIFGLGMWLKSVGWLRGKEDDDDQEYFDKLTGHQDYALELPGGFSYSLDWLSPVSMPLFMGVEFMNAIQEGGLSARDLLSALGAGSEAFWDPMLEMSMLSGINDTLDSISYSNNKWGRLAVQLGLAYLTQGLSNTLLGQLERISEPNRMSTYTNKDSKLPTWLQREIGRFSAKTPGWDYRQREYTDVWGETQSNGGLGTRILANLFSPGYVSHVEMNDVEAELQRVAKQTGDTSIFPGTAVKDFTVDGKKVYLTMDEYSKYAKVLGEYRREVYMDILLSSAYKKSRNIDRVGILERGEKYAYQFAKSDILEDDNVINKWALYAHDAKKDLGISTADYLYYVDKYGADVTSNNHEKAVEAHRRGMDAGIFFTYAVGRKGSDADGSGGLSITEQAESINAAKRKLGLSDKDTETLWLVYNDGWEEAAKKAEVSNRVYIDFKIATYGIVGDKDATGNTVAGSKKEKVLDAINGLNISADEKDKLYYAAGYSPNTINEAPWH